MAVKKIVRGKISLCFKLFLCLAIVSFSMAFSPGTANAATSPTVCINKLADVDIVLTVGTTTQDITNYSADLKNKLVEKGIPAGRIHISSKQMSSFTSSDGDAKTIFDTWTNYPDSTGQWRFDEASRSIGSTQNVAWTGYWNSSSEAQKTKDIVINYDFADTFRNRDISPMRNYTGATYKCHPDPQGFTFRMTRDAAANTYSYYAFWVYTYQQVAGLFKVTNVSSPNNAGNGILAAWTGTVNPVVGSTLQNTTCLGFANVDVDPTKPHHVKIEATGNRIKIYYENSSTALFDVSDINRPLLQGSYGPFTYSNPNAKLFNMGVSADSTKTFNEVIREPDWKEGSKRFIVNLDDTTTTGLSDGDADLPEILSRMDNDDLYYIGWGKDANKDQSIGTDSISGFIAKNSDKGLFVNRDADGRTYAGDIDAMASYIYSIYSTSIMPDVTYLPYGSPYTIDVTPASEKMNTADADFPSGKWRVIHDPSVYENNDGTASYSGNYLNSLDVEFEKPGKYDIYYANSSSPVKTLYIHRKPVGSFSIALDSSYNVSVTDNSYDPDKRSDADRGIAVSQWQWKEAASDTWTGGQPAAFTAGKDYLVELKVQDHEGEWSTAYSRYSTSKAGTVKPVADFFISSEKLYEDSLGNTVVIDEKSYDPAGKGLTSEWTVYKNGAVIYGPSVAPKTDFSGLTAGEYKISLRVKNSSNIWSEVFSRLLTIHAVTPNFHTRLLEKNNVSAAVYGKVDYAGIIHSSPIVKRGIEYRSVSEAVYTRALDTGEGEGDFTVILTGLSPGTAYYARSFSINSLGISKYDAAEVSFTTDAAETPPAGEVTVTDTLLVRTAATTATVSASVYSTGSIAIVRRGIQYRKTVGESVYSEKVEAGTGTGTFTVDLTGLSPNTEYIVRGFASSLSSTAYDPIGVSFTTEASITPEISVYSPIIYEAAADNGSISVAQAVYLTNGIFASDMSSGVTVNNLPSGLGISVTRNSDTKITVAFTGNAANHTTADNVSNASITVDESKISGAEGNVTTGYFSFVFTGSPSAALFQDKEALTPIYAHGDSAEHVTATLYLPLKGSSGHTAVIWRSSSTALITNTGRVTRPEPDGADTTVTLTATLTDNATGAAATKTFSLKVLKLADQDAAEDAAKNLTTAKAFRFETGDTWEAITNAFFAVATGDHGTTITWASDNDAITLLNGSSETVANVTRPADSNMNTILTATIRRGNASVTKTFLLVVQKNGVSKTVTRQTTSRTVTASTDSNPTIQTFTIERSVLEDNTKIDYVLLDANRILTLTDTMNPQSGEESQNTVMVAMNQNSSDPAQQLAIEIPATAVAAMADRNARLEIKTDEGSIKLEQSVLNQMASRGTDLFFRIVPVYDSAEKTQAAASARGNSAVIQMVGNKQLGILGLPRKIETNYTNFNTNVILPLTGITVPATGAQAFLDSLKVFVEHSDNTTELLDPLNIIYDNGEPTGVEFRINRFSRFQIIRAYAESSGGAITTPAASTGVDVMVGGTKQKDVVSVNTAQNPNGGNDITITVNNDKLSEKVKTGNSGESVTILTADIADKLGIKLNGELLKALQDKNDTLVIGTPAVSWSIPAGAVDINSVYDMLGKPSDISDIEINMTLGSLPGTEYDKIKTAIKAKGAEMLSDAIDFKIVLSCNSKSVEPGKFRQYAETVITLPKDIDPKKITTGVYVSRELDISHVPTRVTIADGIYYARINSLYSSGTHTVIWNSKEFPDVANHWSKEETNDMGSRMVVSGVDTGAYEPDRVITRAEFASILAKGLGLRSVSTSGPFTDVKPDAWYNEVIKIAAAFKLIEGYGNGTFGPDRAISREEAMAMTARAMNLVELDTNVEKAEANEQLKKFTDGGSVAEWASQYAAACIRSGIIEGFNGTVRPKDSITRAEAAAVIRKVLKKADMI